MDTAVITRQDIVNFPFPYKLWLAVNLDFCDFLCWNRDGTVVLLDLVGLDDYLSSTRSIFKIKNRSVFLQHLHEFKFERLNVNPEEEEDILLQYKNVNFQRHRLDLLAKIRRCAFQLMGDTGGEELKSHNSPVADRMLGDLCFMFHGGLSNIQKSRMRFQTVFNFQNETRLLREKLQASDEKVARNGRDDDHVIEIPAELFENPHDSVLNLGDDFRPEYAGYYGNCSKETISNFFGEYLPMYEDGSSEIRRVIADNSTINNNNRLDSGSGEAGFIMQPPYSIDIDPNAVVNSTCGELPTITDLNFSSTLEPIFKTDDEQEDSFQIKTNSTSSTQILPKNIDIEDEISMEEFITFKDPLAFNKIDTVENAAEELENIMEIVDSPNETCSLQSTAVERYPQMPADVKWEIQEDQTVQNEANFRNFFSQYRSSLKLLYERH